MSEHEQCVEVFRDVDPEPLARVTEHAQRVRFGDPRIRQGKRLGSLQDRVVPHEFKILDQVLKQIDAPQRRPVQEELRWDEGRLGLVFVHKASLQSMSASRDLLSGRKLQRRPEIELIG